MRRPRVKPEHAPYRVSGGRIRIGGVVLGIAAEIRDPTGAIWTLLEALDGTRDPEDILAHVAMTHPDLPTQTLRGWLDQLVGSGYVEDADETVPSDLTERDRIRYGRGRRFFCWVDLTPAGNTWRPQTALRRARVTVLGIGGTGGAAAIALAASGVGRLHLVDHDRVELSNLNRQLVYTEDDIGTAKTDAAAARLRKLNTDITVTTTCAQITSDADVAAFARDCDVLLLCADAPRDTRRWTNRACQTTGTPWIDAGYHGPLLQVATYLPGRSACWECLQIAGWERHHAEGANPHDGGHRHLATANAANAISAGISGHLAAHAVISLITGAPSTTPGRITTVNLVDLAAPPVTVDSPRRPDCPGCGQPADRSGTAAAVVATAGRK